MPHHTLVESDITYRDFILDSHLQSVAIPPLCRFNALRLPLGITM